MSRLVQATIVLLHATCGLIRNQRGCYSTITARLRGMLLACVGRLATTVASRTPWTWVRCIYEFVRPCHHPGPRSIFGVWPDSYLRYVWYSQHHGFTYLYRWRRLYCNCSSSTVAPVRLGRHLSTTTQDTNGWDSYVVASVIGTLTTAFGLVFHLAPHT